MSLSISSISWSNDSRTLRFSWAFLSRFSASCWVRCYSLWHSLMWVSSLPFSASSCSPWRSSSLLKPRTLVHSPLSLASSDSFSPSLVLRSMYFCFCLAYSSWSASRYLWRSSTVWESCLISYSFYLSFWLWSYSIFWWDLPKFSNLCLMHLIWSSRD